MALSNIKCNNLRPKEKAYKTADGEGLYMLIQPAGGKLWRLAYRFSGKQKTLAIGAYPAVSLKDARSKREWAKENLAKGLDPSAIKKAEKRASNAAGTNTFELIAREWFDARRAGWTQGYSDRLIRRLEADIFPIIGGRSISEIEPPELLAAIRQIESRGAIELAKRILQVCGQVFRFAVASGRTIRDPSQDLRGALRTAGPVKHRTAMKAAELPDFLKALEIYDGSKSTVLGLKLLIHTFLRTSEVRFGRWSEIEGLDSTAPLWRIPAERMKMRSEHLVPITPQAAVILGELKKLSATSEFILPAATKERVTSQNTFIFALYRLGYHSRATVHGFRGTASTILNENGFNRDWIERQLAHTERNQVRAAYNSADWLPDRRKMMEWWSDYLDAATYGTKVVPFADFKA